MPESQQKGMLVSLVNLLAVDIDDDNGAQGLCRVSVKVASWLILVLCDLKAEGSV